MTDKPSPSQDYPFTGYRYHKKETSLAALWQSFLTSQKQAAEWRAKMDDKGQYQAVDTERVERYWENELQKINEDGK